jgi:hypothetical protein
MARRNGSIRLDLAPPSWGCQDSADMAMPAELKERVLASVRRTPSPARSEGRREAYRVVALAVGIAATLFFVAGGVHHALGRPAWSLAASLSLWLVVATLAMQTAWRGGVTFASGSPAALAAVTVCAPLVLLVATSVLVSAAPELAFVHPERVGLRCFVLTIAAAAYPLIGLSRVRRSSDPMHPVASGAALGVACGACAGVVVDLWCPVSAPAHVLVGHIFPLVALGAGGAVLGARVIAMRCESDRHDARERQV